MTRLEKLYANARAEGRRVLNVFLCVGDPSLDESFELALAAIEAGAEVLELGVPFSDPVADGETIAKAAARAIEGGATLAKVVEVAAKIRAKSDVPLVLFSYYNPVFVFGEAKLVEAAKAAGIDALLIVDLPLEEGAELRAMAKKAGIAMVPLLTPTSSEARVKLAREVGSGFVYYVSVTGVTGKASETALAEATKQAARIREATGLPVVVGFGIDGPEKARIAAQGADGVVVGTAVVKAYEKEGGEEGRREAVRRIVRGIGEGVR